MPFKLQINVFPNFRTPEVTHEAEEDVDDPPPRPETTLSLKNAHIPPHTLKEDDVLPPPTHTQPPKKHNTLNTLNTTRKEEGVLPIAGDVQLLREELPSSTQGTEDTTMLNQGGDEGEKGDKLTLSEGYTRASCVYTAKGVCNTHGGGARRTWEPSYTRATRPDGTVYKKYVRITKYVCDLDQKGVKKLRQTKISFPKKTQRDGGGVLDSLVEGPDRNCTSTEGQNKL